MAKAKKTTRKTAKKSSKRKKEIKMRNSPAHDFAKFAILGTVAAFGLWLLSGLASAGLVSQMTTWISEKSLQATAQTGFAIREVSVAGRSRTDPEELRCLLNVEEGAPIFGFDPAMAATRIASISWVEDVRIRRSLPDKITVNLTERVPVAMWQNDGSLAVIDREGRVLTRDNLEEFSYLPLVIGKDAHKHIAALSVMLNAEPELTKYLESAVRIGERRWDLLLTGGTRVKLPEHAPEFALAALMKMHKDEKILDHQWISIDLRVENRAVFRPERAAINTTTTASAGHGNKDVKN
jgi:cell division protein FtsQ